MINKIAFIILVIFGFVGAVLIGIVLHEYSHAYDYKDVAENREICALVMPENPKDILTNNAGYFSFKYNNEPNSIMKVKDIEKYTEIKAYSFTFLIMFIFIASVFIVVINNSAKEKNQIEKFLWSNKT